MAGRKRGNVRNLLLFIALVAIAALCGALYTAVGETRDALYAAREAESLLSAGRAAWSDGAEELAARTAEANAFREKAEQSDAYLAELTQCRAELQAAIAEAERMGSLVDALEERSALLSDSNDELRVTLNALRERTQQAEQAQSSIATALTEKEEQYAGLSALYEETCARLSQSAVQSERRKTRVDALETELRSAYLLLTEAEEAYAGVSALLSESEREVGEARRIALSRSNEADMVERAAAAKEEEIARLASELEKTRAALDKALAEAEAAGSVSDAMAYTEAANAGAWKERETVPDAGPTDMSAEGRRYVSGNVPLYAHRIP